MKPLLLIGFSVCLLLSCASVQYTPEEQSYLDRVKKNGNSVTLPKTMEREAWSRVAMFIAKYSSKKVQNQSDFMIETYNATLATERAYSANKVVAGDSIEILVKCNAGNDWFGSAAPKCRQNENIMIEYIKTGRTEYPQFIDK